MGNPLDVLGGLDDAAAYKIPCKVATTGDMTATMIGLPVIDGYQVLQYDRILVWQNTNQATNGVYAAISGAWTRTTDFSNSSAVYFGTQVLVLNGTYAYQIFSVTSPDQPNIGSSPITFAANVVVDAAAKLYADEAAASASTAAAIAMTNWGVWTTRTAFAAASIASAITGVVLVGNAAPGDADLVVMAKLASPPSPAQPWHTQTADGAWWVLAGGRIDFRLFGASTTSSDCTAAMNNAILFAASIKGQVKCPGGSYNFAGSIAVHSSGVSIEGDGQWVTTFVFTGTTFGDCFNCAISPPSISNPPLETGAIRGLTVDATARTAGSAFDIQWTFWSVTVEDVSIVNAVRGFNLYATNSVIIKNVLIQGCSDTGVYWAAPADGTFGSPLLTIADLAVNCQYAVGSNGIVLDGAVGTLDLVNFTVLDANIGMHVKNSTNSANYVPEFINCVNLVTDGMITRSLQIDGGREMYFTDCWLQNTSTPGSPAPPAGQGGNDQEAIYIDGNVGHSDTSDIRFSNCRIGNTAQRAVTLTNSARDVTFNDCLLEPGGKSSPGNWDAIFIDSGCQDIEVSNCKFATWGDPLNWRSGVYVAASTYRISVKDCQMYGVQSRLVYWLNNDSDSYCDNLVGPTPGSPGRLAKSGWSIPAEFNPFNGQTLTAAQILGGVLDLGGAPGSIAMNMPTAAAMVAALQNPFYLATVDLLFVNTTNGTITLNQGAGAPFVGNLSAPGQVAIPSTTQRFFKIVFSSTAGGSEACTIYG